jgi:hypothetical protein
MGDGPGYDHLANQLEEEHQEKIARKRKRLFALYEMRQTVGLSERSRSLSLVDQQINHHLEMAVELLELSTIDIKTVEPVAHRAPRVRVRWADKK